MGIRGIIALVGLGLLPSPAAWGAGFDFNRLVDTSTAVPGGSFGNFTDVKLVGADGPNVAFIGSFHAGAQTYSGLYQYHDGQVSTIADLTVGAPSGGTFQQVVAGNEYVGGNLVFGASTESGLGIFRFNGTNIQTVFAPGATLPDPGGAVGGTLANLESKGVSGDANIAVFGGTGSTGMHALHSVSGGQVNFLANEETHVPGFELGVFHSFPEVHARGSETLFVGTALDPDFPDPIFEPAGVFRTLPDGVIQAVATRSTIIPDAPDLYFREFENPRIGSDGRYYFTGGFIEEEAPPGAAHKRGRGGVPERFMGVFAFDAVGNIETLADSEMPLPGLKAEILEFNRYSFDGGARVFGVNDINDVSYLYIQDANGQFVHVLDSTELLDGKPLATLRMTLDPAVDGVVNFRAVFADGSSGIYSFSAVPEPAGASLLIVAALGAFRRRR